jgi:hypothetical protein
MIILVAVLAAMSVGFLTGLLTFRRATHWCPVCGLTLTCPLPEHRQLTRPEATP